MGKIYRYFLLIAAAISLVACNEFSFGGKPEEIQLYARFGARGLQTRSSDTSYVYHTQSQVEIPVALARIDEADANYPSFSSCGQYATATMRTPDGSGIREIHLDKAQFYKNSSDHIKYAGFSPIPASGNYTSAASGTTVSYTVDGSKDIIYGSVITGKEGSDFETMYFNHALSEVRVWVYQTVAVDENGNIVNTENNWGEFNALTLSGLVDECSLTLPKDEDGTWGISYGTHTSDIVFSEASDIYFNPGEIPISYDERRKVGVAMIVPPANNRLDIKYKTDASNEEKLVSIAKEFRPGYAYDVILRFTQFGIIEAAVTVGEWTGQDGEFTDVYINQGIKVYNNLSRYGTANCYIINSGNFLYGFDCKVKGNGNVKLVAENDPSLDVNWLEILWKDSNLPEKVKDKDGNDIPYVKLTNKPADNLVKFEVAGNPNPNDHTLTYEGNIVIGGYDQEGGTLLWTWHLWLTKKAEGEGDGNGYIIMDRNLGATSADKNGGMYYQWGRMTPLQNSAAYSGSQASSINQAIVNYSTVYGSASGDWLSGSDNSISLWGYQSDFKDQDKTIYDPCPLGYTVADQRVWENGSYNGDVWTFASTAAPYAISYGSNTYQSNTPRAVKKHVRCIAEGKEARSVKNLSEAQTANSYIVSKNGYYKFNVLTRGNGVALLEPVGGNGLIWDINHGVSTSIRKVEISTVMPRWWQGDFREYSTWSAIDPSNTSELNKHMGGIRFLLNDGSWSTDHADVDDEGYVTFQITSWKPGNLLMAAYDLNNTVLWSWHLWFTEEPKNKREGDFAILDRNLGATYVPNGVNFDNTGQRWASYGYLYQWGRKDPLFHEAPDNKLTGGTVTGNTATSSVWFHNTPASGWVKRYELEINSANSSMSIDEARKNPELFFKAGATNNNNSTWFLPEYASNNDKSSTALWGYAVWSTALGRSFTKTVNDPCPPGYRTLSHEALFLHGGDGAYGPTDITNYNQNGRRTVSKGTYGVVTNYNGDDVFWPFAGRRIYTGQSEAITTSCNYATGMPMGQYNTRSAELYRNNNTYYHAQRAGTYGSSTAMSVRCMKE